MASLILLKSPGGGGPEPGQVFPLTSGSDVFVIGRDADQCEIPIANGAVSRRHAQITRKGEQYVLEDLGSRNHTFVNNNKISAPTPMNTEDRIKICDFLFRFVSEPGPKPLVRLKPPEDEPDYPVSEPTTVQTTVSQNAAQQFLEIQPSDRIRILLDISTTLSKSLKLGPLLSQVAETLFNVFRQADRCFLIMLDESGRLIPKEVKTRRALTMEDRFSQTIVRKCLKSGQSYLSEDASNDSAFSGAQSIAEFRIRSMMCAPLITAEGKQLGAIQVDTQDIGKKFREDDLKLLTIVANLVSVAVDKAQVHATLLTREKERREVEIARTVQIGFLPKSYPPLEGFEFYSFYSPAQSVGGDFYDFVTLPHGRIAVVLGDVAGKGVAAALLMAKLSAEVRFCLLTESNLPRAITMLSDQLIAGGIGDRFVTLAALVIDPLKEQVTVVNAGHINPIRVRPDSTELCEIISNKESGLPLGLVEGYPYEAKVVPYQIGDSFMVFTDGVTDAENPLDVRFEMQGVTQALFQDSAIDSDSRPHDFGDRVVRAVLNHAQGRAQSDDIALVCFGRTDTGAGPPTRSNLVPKLVESSLGISSEQE